MSAHAAAQQLFFAARTLVRGGPTRPHRPRLVASHSTRRPSSPPLPAHSFYIGPAVINNNYGVTVVGVVGNPIQNKFRYREKTRFRDGHDKAPFHP